jgi:hypothetical protein
MSPLRLKTTAGVATLVDLADRVNLVDGNRLSTRVHSGPLSPLPRLVFRLGVLRGYSLCSLRLCGEI